MNTALSIVIVLLIAIELFIIWRMRAKQESPPSDFWMDSGLPTEPKNWSAKE